jgi:hypothetical protein
VGVVAGDTNQKIVSVLTVFKTVALDQVRRAFDTKEMGRPLRYTAERQILVAGTRAIPAERENRSSPDPDRECRGNCREGARLRELRHLRGAPPVPEDDVTTLQVSFYLVGKKSLDNDMIAGFTQAITSARRDLLAEWPILAQFKAPDTDAGAYLPVHPGAAEFYNDNQQTFLDKWSNAIFLAPMALGALATVLAAAWQFLRSGELKPSEPALDSLYALGRRIRHAENEKELLEIENQIDEVLRAQRASADEDEYALDAATLNVAAHRLENLIHDRRAMLAQPNLKSRR